jgi:hypothetical protein
MSPLFFVQNINNIYNRVNFRDFYVRPRNIFSVTPAFNHYQKLTNNQKEELINSFTARLFTNLQYRPNEKIKKWRLIDNDPDFVKCRIKDEFYDLHNNNLITITMEFEVIHFNGILYLNVKIITF